MPKNFLAYFACRMRGSRLRLQGGLTEIIDEWVILLTPLWLCLIASIGDWECSKKPLVGYEILCTYFNIKSELHYSQTREVFLN